MKNQDRRIQRTQARLRNALIDLILQKGYDVITIREITDQAQVGYATFFRHYEGKDELLADAFEHSISELHTLLSVLGGSNPEEKGTLIFAHIKKHQDLYSIFLQGHGTQRLLNRVINESVSDILLRYSRYTPSIPPAVLANHLVSSIVSLIKWWLCNDMPFSPEEMGAFYATLILNPIENLIASELEPYSLQAAG